LLPARNVTTPKLRRYRSVTNILSFNQKIPNNTKIPKNKIIIVIYIALLKQLVNVMDIINFCSELWLQM